MIRRAFKTLPEVPVRTFKCIPFREMPEVYHRFMNILHCFISPKVSLPIRVVSLELVYLVLQLQSPPYGAEKEWTAGRWNSHMGSIVLFVCIPTILFHGTWEPEACCFPSIKEWRNEKDWGFGVFHFVNALLGYGVFLNLNFTWFSLTEFTSSSCQLTPLKSQFFSCSLWAGFIT